MMPPPGASTTAPQPGAIPPVAPPQNPPLPTAAGGQTNILAQLAAMNPNVLKQLLGQQQGATPAGKGGAGPTMGTGGLY